MPLYPHMKPPVFTPAYCSVMKGTGPEFIRQYIGMFVYVWTVKGSGFWLFPVFIRANILYGYVWRRSQPRYIRLQISKIDCLF